MSGESWAIRFEITEASLPYETALTELCDVQVVSVSRPYLDAPFWVVEGFCDFEPDEGVVKAALAGASSDGVVPEFEIIAFGTRDWLAENRAAFPALHIGQFWIHGAHITDPPPAGAKSLHVEAAEAFGSGTHPTTEGCLRAIDSLVKKTRPASVLDLGAGSAILAMAVLKAVPSCSMMASDIDPVATRTASANRRLNAIAPAKMRCVTSKGFAHKSMRRNAPYDLLIANILAGPLKQMAPDIARFLAPSGQLILSGLLVEQERQIRAAYRQYGLVIAKRIRIDGWSCLVLRRQNRKVVV